MRNEMSLSLIVSVVGTLAGGCVAEEESTYTPAETGRHCLVHLEPEPGAAPGGLARLGELSCYDTVAEVLQVATSGRVNVPASTEGRELDPRLVDAANEEAAAAAIGQIVIGVDYELPSYGGASLTWTAPFGCYDRTSGATYSWTANLPAGWDNVVSSVQTFGRCSGASVYDLPNRAGLSQAVFGCRSASLTFMDNLTSSQDWRFGSACPL
jgi:hypothetical protein